MFFGELQINANRPLNRKSDRSLITASKRLNIAKLSNLDVFPVATKMDGCNIHVKL